MNSDSVNLGSNPSSPATQNIEVSGKTAPGHPGHPGQTAHTGRTEVGTVDGRYFPGHTPGPWWVKPGHSVVDVESAQGHVATVEGDDGYWVRHTAVDAANARLVAAAPELLAFLEIALEDYECRMGAVSAEQMPGHWIVQARAAIAKATGATP
jgi:hypothetical protein